MYIPEIHKARKAISGLKMPRRYAPRLPGASTKGQVPVNPFSGNRMKVASLSEFREAQLLKTASLSEEILYRHMKKLAEHGDPDEIYQFMMENAEMEKEGGIIARGYKLLARGLGAVGAKNLSQAAARRAGAAKARFRANNPRRYMPEYVPPKPPPPGATGAGATGAAGAGAKGATGAGAKGAAGGGAAGAGAKGATGAAGGGAAGAAGATGAAGGGAAGATGAAGAAGGGAAGATGAVTEEPSRFLSDSTLGYLAGGGLLAGGLGLAGYGAYRGMQRGQAQNQQQAMRGFNYGE